MQESQGTIVDRTKEHLGSSDAAIVKCRRRLIESARQFAKDGTIPVAAAGSSVQASGRSHPLAQGNDGTRRGNAPSHSPDHLTLQRRGRAAFTPRQLLESTRSRQGNACAVAPLSQNRRSGASRRLLLAS